jgi:predicted metal-binding membrane protein
VLWAQSPYGRYLDHGDWTKIGIAGALCSALPAGEALAPAVLYVGGWVLMLTAMMLPTTLPLLETHRRLTQRRADRWLLLGLVVAGYLWPGSASGSWRTPPTLPSTKRSPGVRG